MAGAKTPNSITLQVTSEVVGFSYMRDYQGDSALYLVPTYRMNLYVGDAQTPVATYEVIRFGIASTVKVKNSEGKYEYKAVPPYVCGCKEGPRDGYDSYEIKQSENYRPQSAPGERGGWRIYGRSLVHVGPDDPRTNNRWGDSNCIEVCGKGKWTELNDRILEESGLVSDASILSPEDRAKYLAKIAEDKKLFIDYQ